MGRLTINTTEAQTFEATDPGLYNMTIDQIDDAAPSKAKGTLGTWIYYKHDDPNIQQRCGRARKFYPLEGPGSGFFMQLWKNLTGEDLPVGMENIDIDPDILLGKPVQVQLLLTKLDDGRMVNEVETVIAE